MHIAKALAPDSQLLRPPDARSDEDSLVPVSEEISDLQCPADRCIWSDADAYTPQESAVTFKDGFGQTKFRYTVLHYPSDFVLGIEDGHLVSALCHLDGDSDSCRAGAYDSHPFAVPLRDVYPELIKACV